MDQRGAFILKRWSKKGPRVHLESSCIQIRPLKLFAGDSECQIKARDEVYFWLSFFFFPLKILPKVIALLNFMVPKHYLAYSQDPSGHWKSGGHIWKWDFQGQAMPWRFSSQNEYQMFYLITMNSQNKHVANSWVQRLYPIITAAIFFFTVEFRFFSKLTTPFERKTKMLSVSSLRSRTGSHLFLCSLTQNEKPFM